MLNQVLNHLKMAIWHLREAKLAALRAKFSYAKGALDIIVCALAWLEGVIRDLGTAGTEPTSKILIVREREKVKSETVMPDISKGRTSQEASHDYTLRTVCRQPVKERYRRYTFKDDDVVVIKSPKFVSRGIENDIIWDFYGLEYWVPKTWKLLEIEKL